MCSLNESITGRGQQKHDSAFRQDWNVRETDGLMLRFDFDFAFILVAVRSRSSDEVILEWRRPGTERKREREEDRKGEG